ncbi:MAG TPA: FAD-dependent oxidoreductase [Candidatus Paceibacterota bacterium]|nr:FAD-dependent oxidoreductase [Candidatus Paceibacterota bacterium]HPT18327.1 FAD-dependent oxidoreductase [Candidatus Paceibacterota bacterium]
MSFFKLKLKKKEIKYEDVAILDFSIVGKNKLKFTPGQYMNLSSPKNNLGRAYTIISQPNDNLIRFAVRKKGEFSTLLSNLKINEIINADGPYGNFCPDNTDKKIICIAGGIGITPFISWINKDDFKNTEVTFLFSNGSIDRSPFLEDIVNNKRIKNTLFITKEKGIKDRKIVRHRIEKEDIKKVIINKKETVIAICGSIGFTRDIWKMVKSLGIPEDQIITESFF